jgi:ribonuclease P protein component
MDRADLSCQAMNPLSLPKVYLLRNKSEFDNVYRHGKRVHGVNFSLILLPNSLEHNRLGISVHGQLKGAAKRNRIKRIIREFFRLDRRFFQEMSSRSRELPSMDMVITVRKGFNLEKLTNFAVAVSSLLERRKSFL